MRAQEFIVENYATNLSIQEIKQILRIVEDEADADRSAILNGLARVKDMFK